VRSPSASGQCGDGVVAAMGQIGFAKQSVLLLFGFSSSTTAGPSRQDLQREARLVSILVFLANEAAYFSFSGMPSPFPKNISSWVWPSNAECKVTLLCCSTQNAINRRTFSKVSNVLMYNH
jgi:hypothetical protein